MISEPAVFVYHWFFKVYRKNHVNRFTDHLRAWNKVAVWYLEPGCAKAIGMPSNKQTEQQSTEVARNTTGNGRNCTERFHFISDWCLICKHKLFQPLILRCLYFVWTFIGTSVRWRLSSSLMPFQLVILSVRILMLVSTAVVGLQIGDSSHCCALYSIKWHSRPQL